MATALKALKRLQIGLEATQGTGVAATFKVVGECMPEFLAERELEDFARGYMGPVTGGGILVKTATNLPVEGNLTYEEIAYVLSTCLNVVSTAGVGPYVHTFDRSWVAAPTIKTVTAEITEDTGSTKHVQREAAFCYTTGFEVSLAVGKIARLKWGLAGQAATDTTETPSLSALTGRSPIASGLFKFYLDSSWAGLGGTLKSATLRAATFKYDPGITPNYPLDGRAALDFTGLNYGQAKGSLSLTCELNANAATEIAAYEAGTKRYIRLIATDGTKIVKFDMCAVHVSPPAYSDEDGIRVATFNLALEIDTTTPNMFKAVITNSLATL